ncbi:MAG: hypothetical protein ACK45H_03150 [Bacteroidota bacterium]|jgi:hypothetical protein
MKLTRTILSIAIGLIIGNILNMCIIMTSGSIIPPPQGADVTTYEGLKATMHLFEPKHYILPFLAHALGTLTGSLTAALIAQKNKMVFSMIIGAIFLIGGIWMVSIVPSPLWFTITDLTLAYIPMAFIAGKLASRKWR